MKPFFSIVLPCWNSENYIERCIKSIKKQTFKRFEVIIIDNCSTDQTLKKIKNIIDNRFKIFSINNNGILAKSRNLGIKKSTTEWVVFLDSDDWWNDNKLEICYKNINDNIDFLYHDLEIKSEKNYFFKKKNKSRQLIKPVLTDLLINMNPISNSSVVVRKNILFKIKGISENKNIPASEDYHAWLKISKITDNFLYLPFTLGYYFVHKKSMSNKNMAIPMKYAVSEFLHTLTSKQKKN